LQTILDGCISYFNFTADSCSDAESMPLLLKDYMYSLLGETAPEPKPPSSWIPPPFEDAEQYCCTVCHEGREIVNLGIFHGKELQVLLAGHVVCWGDADDDFFGNGLLKVQLGQHVTQVFNVVVLGSIVATGTAVLLDDHQRIWLFNVPNCVDPYLDGMNSKAALVTDGEKSVEACSAVKFVEEYADASVELTREEYE
jgi:hypothetical protein